MFKVLVLPKFLLVPKNRNKDFFRVRLISEILVKVAMIAKIGLVDNLFRYTL